jgi:hypothetical protein
MTETKQGWFVGSRRAVSGCGILSGIVRVTNGIAGTRQDAVHAAPLQRIKIMVEFLSFGGAN